MDVEQSNPFHCKRTTSLSLAHLGYISPSLSTASHQLRKGCGLSQLLGTVGATLQAFQVMAIMVSLPAIECMEIDATIAAGQVDVVTMRIVVIKPF